MKRIREDNLNILKKGDWLYWDDPDQVREFLSVIDNIDNDNGELSETLCWVKTFGNNYWRECKPANNEKMSLKNLRNGLWFGSFQMWKLNPSEIEKYKLEITEAKI